MSFPKLLSFTKKVADFADQVTGNPADIKAQFDAAPDELRQTYNNLIDGLKSTASGDSGAKNLGATAIPGIAGTDVQTILESLKAKTDNGALFGQCNGVSFGSGFQVFTAPGYVTEMNAGLFSARDGSRFNILKAGLYQVDFSVFRSDLPANQQFTVGFCLNDDNTKQWTEQLIMGSTGWGQASVNASRINNRINHMVRCNAGDWIYFYITSDDGPRSYWYKYRMIRISD